MKPDLRAVPTELPDPPYPSDTRANGWRFEIDFERIKRSDTWMLATPDQRPWLLMIWTVAFDEIPAGSLPNDHRLIGAKIGQSEHWVSGNSPILLRGFKLHSDGRLYHPVCVERMLQLIEFRDKETKRKRVYRERLSRGTDTGLTRTSGGVPVQEQEQEQEYIPVLNNLHPVGTTETAPENGDSSVLAKRRSCPYRKILDLWAEMLPNLPQPVKLTPARRTQIRARWEDELPDLDSWRECFGYIRASPFLMGKIDPPPGRKRFQATLEWVTKLDNLCKLYEGKYDGKVR